MVGFAPSGQLPLDPAAVAHRASVASYGSAAGELAACVSAVGIADRSELTKLELCGPSDRLTTLVAGMAGARPLAGGAARGSGAWWCAPSPERIVVVCEPDVGEPLLIQLRARAQRRAAVSLIDRSDEWAAIAVVGRRAPGVLAALGVYGEGGDPRRVPPTVEHPLAGEGALWLLESDRHALALVPRAGADAAWRAIERAGLRFGICAVGREALARYALAERFL